MFSYVKPCSKIKRNIRETFTDSSSAPPSSPLPIRKQFKLLSAEIIFVYYVLPANFYQFIQSADVFSERFFVLQVVTGSIICPANDIQVVSLINCVKWLTIKPWKIQQQYYYRKVDLGCGSTIGTMT
jgi:hypothetical protein